MSSRICAGIVLFNPDIIRLQENINAVVDCVETVYLQDNGSSNILEVETLIQDRLNVILLRSSKNNGIAWALNQLCNRADFDGFQWILTLDQDSVCPANMIEIYSKYLDDADMLCPKIIDRNYGLLDGDDTESTIVQKCITSGCLLKLASWKILNGFDEAMFIDGVDFEFCYRMTKCGMKILRVNGVVLNHEIGNITVRRFLGMKVIVKNHSAFRKYYIARNILYLAKKKNRIQSGIKAIFQEIKLIGIIVLYETNKREKLSKVFQGISDGLLGKYTTIA